MDNAPFRYPKKKRFYHKTKIFPQPKQTRSEGAFFPAKIANQTSKKGFVPYPGTHGGRSRAEVILGGVGLRTLGVDVGLRSNWGDVGLRTRNWKRVHENERFRRKALHRLVLPGA